MTLLTAVAQFERELMLERQKVGIDAAKEAGKYAGRKATARVKTAKVLQLKAKGLSNADITKATKIGVASVYRILNDDAKSKAAATS